MLLEPNSPLRTGSGDFRSDGFGLGLREFKGPKLPKLNSKDPPPPPKKKKLILLLQPCVKWIPEVEGLDNAGGPPTKRDSSWARPA